MNWHCPTGRWGRFIRNLIWDHLHRKAVPTALNDIDLIYLDSADPTGLQEADHEARLAARMPGQQWRCATRPACMCASLCPRSPARSALSHWVEVPTCIGVRLLADDSFEWLAPTALPQLVPAGGSQPALPPGEPGLYRAGQDQEWQRLWPDLVVNWP
ncbi:nucleotidyltransferase family protein [Aeromonas hydrophila]|uniref:Nucleotidyltransferase family protein n=1 Tax=Aeromonas hydrophila TaxID=644 RepID=A0A926FPJ5_AERHY|nr:nucleotidyltransferase family protein [Aeromonas hydrophila]